MTARALFTVVVLLLPSPGAWADTMTSDYSVLDVAFYSASLVVLVVCFLINTAIKNPPGIYYTIMFLLGLFFVFLIDGGIAILSVPDRFEEPIIWTTALVSISFSFFTALSAFDPQKRLPKLKVIMWLLAALSLCVISAVWLIPGDWERYLVRALFIATVIGHILSTSTWKHLDESSQITPVIVPSIGLLLSAMYILSEMTGYGSDLLFSVNAAKIIFTIILVPTLLAVIIALADVRLARDRALEEALETARRDAETNAHLLNMEKQYARARDAASVRSRQLASASHDIRQPLSSLTAELDALQSDLPLETIQRFRRVVEHISQLTTSLSHSAKTPIEAGLHGEVHIETVELSLLFDTLQRLFSADARRSGVSLEVKKPDGSILVAPLILIRILSNILSNAIQHSSASRISVVAEHLEHHVCIKVADDGHGLPKEILEQVFKSGIKGRTSDGEGLGLAIVNELAKSYDMPIKIISDKSGTVFSISVSKAT